MTVNERLLYSVFMTIEDAVRKIRKFYLSEHRMPSYQELSDIFGFASKKASYEWIKKLIAKGILGKDEKGKLFPKTLFAMPHLGTIKAGYPMQAFDLHDDSIDVYNYLHDTTGDIYFLTVSGDSMIEAAIEEGDKIIVDPSQKPKNGDIVAAIVDNEWTVKYYFNVNGSIELRPANKNYPIIFPKQSLEIGGVVTAVIRKY